MRPSPWQPPIELSPAEQTVMSRIKRAKLFIFLRQHRQRLFDDAFQQELATIYKDSPLGQPPVPPAQLALATILQAYTGVGDDEAIEATVMDRRWQLVLDCLDGEHAPFSKGTLVTFRQRLIAHDLDRRLIERTVELAAQTKAVGHRQLRAALDSSPLWGAGREQDIEVRPDGTPQLRRGVAKDRRISVEDAAMRHGRKSKSHLFDGFKRHILRDLDRDLVRAVGLTAANVPEASVTDDLEDDLARQDVELRELHIDRAYLASTLVRHRTEHLTIYCKAWRVTNGGRYPKTAFTLDWETGTVRCPNQVGIPFTPGGTVHFPQEHCQVCPLRERCTTSAAGRSVHIHRDERLLQELRERQLTPQGRAKLRERVPAEHALAHIGHWQGDRARYRGTRKNLFDLRRSAVVYNLHSHQRAEQAQAA